nr:MAG TPA: hypothetical protein [Caudoviricetes sp.]
MTFLFLGLATKLPLLQYLGSHHILSQLLFLSFLTFIGVYDFISYCSC